MTVLTGVRDTKDLKRILKYTDAAPEERDYSVLGTFTPQEAKGICVYCNHCQPCPAGLDVGLINKYYDLTRAGDELAKNHYANLEKKAGDCVGCRTLRFTLSVSCGADGTDADNPNIFWTIEGKEIKKYPEVSEYGLLGKTLVFIWNTF